MLHGNTITNAGDGNVFVSHAPDNADYPVTNLGYNGVELAKLGPGAVVATDGPADRIYPRAAAQWTVQGLPRPSAQWDFSDVVATPAWMAATRVVRGDYVVNAGRVYKCVTEGLTAASGGPTGTGTGIADGTATWNHYGEGTGVIRDLISKKDLLIVGTIVPGRNTPGIQPSALHSAHRGEQRVAAALLERVRPR